MTVAIIAALPHPPVLVDAKKLRVLALTGEKRLRRHAHGQCGDGAVPPEASRRDGGVPHVHRRACERVAKAKAEQRAVIEARVFSLTLAGLLARYVGFSPIRGEADVYRQPRRSLLHDTLSGRALAARQGDSDTMLEIDMTAPGIERLVSHAAPLDLIANDLYFGEGPHRNTREVHRA
jgi:hypothetical protein